ncbi:MAG: glycosyltransferase family 2 protein [Nitrososphaera sp.]|nr:glycosyltransferase family 2 protein [Nitrososphaera sp.]
MSVYSYAGYPILLWLIAFLAKRGTSLESVRTEERLPPVTLIISSYNEEKVIGDKIINALSLEYPKDLLEIVIVSDGSSDRTTEIVGRFADRGVVLRHYTGRIGKTACLNSAVPLATGKIIVFSDANSQYRRGALKALVHPFRESTVGFVTGWTSYSSGTDVTVVGTLGIYAKLELVTKELESRLGSCVGADGAIFAIRKELYTPLNVYDINDLVIPLTINEQGYRGAFEKKAFCFEKDAGGATGEFHRQVRIANRTIRAIVNHRQLLNPLKFGLFSFQLFSHKLCRLVVPPFMVTLLILNMLLAPKGGIYLVTLLGQLVFYAVASATAILPKSGVLARLSAPACTFVLVNVAIFYAWVKYLQGETYTTWSPTPRL